MTERTFTTTLMWHDSRGSECEAEVRVTYLGYRGFPGDMVDPPEAPSVEITRIMPVASEYAIPDRFLDDEDLIAECFQHWADEEEAGREFLAEQRADDRMMERFQ